MDAIEFLKKATKICDYFSGECEFSKCPLANNCVDSFLGGEYGNPEKIVKIVEEWEAPISLLDKIRYSERWQNTKCPEWVYKLIEAEEGNND